MGCFERLLLARSGRSYSTQYSLLSNEAKIVQFEKDDRVVRNDVEKGHVYFLEAELVTELLEMIASKRSSRETKAEFVYHYATWMHILPGPLTLKMHEMHHPFLVKAHSVMAR